MDVKKQISQTIETVLNMEVKEQILQAIKTVLIEKNNRYGNAALSPIHVFYKGTATDSIAIRIDDKLSRIRNSDTLRKNDMFDLLGYLFLLQISFAHEHIKEQFTFENEVDAVINRINVFAAPPKLKIVDEPIENVFDKKNEGTETLCGLNLCYHAIENDTIVVGAPIIFATYVVQYFIDNNITDFTDLLD